MAAITVHHCVLKSNKLCYAVPASCTWTKPSPDINDDELFTSGLSKMVVGLARWPHIRKGFYFCYILKAKQIQYCYIYKHESLLSFETVQLIQKEMQNLNIKMSALCFS